MAVMVKNRREILKTIEKNLTVIKGYGTKRLSLFGSAARDENKESSDLDFVVEFNRKSFDAYMDLKMFLEKLFGCSIDLVLANTIKPRIRSFILKEAIHVPGL